MPLDVFSERGRARRFYRRRTPCAACGSSYELSGDVGRRKASAGGKGERGERYSYTHTNLYISGNLSGRWRVVERAAGAVREGDVAVNRRWLKGVLRNSDPVACARTGCEIKHLERNSSSFGPKCMFVSFFLTGSHGCAAWRALSL
jgi:hypothetical protein